VCKVLVFMRFLIEKVWSFHCSVLDLKRFGRFFLTRIFNPFDLINLINLLKKNLQNYE